MNRNTAKILTLAALSSFSVASMAFVAPKTKIETKAIEMPAMPKVEAKAPNAEIKIGNTMNVKAEDIKVGGEGKQRIAGTCDPAMFQRAAQGTSLDESVFREGQIEGTLDVETVDCGKSFIEMEADAREVAGLTSQCEIADGIKGVAGMDARADIGGECLRKVKAKKGVVTSFKKERGNWVKVNKVCGYLH